MAGFDRPAYAISEDAGAAVITVILNAAPTALATVDYATGGGTATPGSDYQAASGTLTFTSSVTTLTFTVPISDDALVEADETISLTLSNPGTAVVEAGSATLIILDDDGAGGPAISIGDASVTEGDGGAVDVVFSVTLSLSSTRPISVAYATGDGSATAGLDYVVVPSATLTFAPGVVARPITVSVLGDDLDEADETFWVNLADLVNAVIGDAQGRGVILEDDWAVYLPLVLRDWASLGRSGWRGPGRR